MLVVVGAMALGSPRVPEVLRSTVGSLFVLIPLAWLVGLILSIIESRRKKRPKQMKIYFFLPFAAWGLNLVVLVMALIWQWR